MRIKPKCDRHRHMGGAISPETVFEILRRSGSRADPDVIRKRLTYEDEHPRDFSYFLKKFEILDDIVWHDWAIDLAVQQICHDVACEGLERCSISFSINKYLRDTRWTAKSVTDFIIRSYRYHSRKHGIQVMLLLSLTYHSPFPLQQHIASVVRDPISDDLNGLDLVGDESYFSKYQYRPIVDMWHNAGKIVRAHVGELPGTSGNTALAIEMDVDRIAHGIRVEHDDLRRAIDNGVVFDMALHSNYYTGAIKDITSHPVKSMIAAGAKVTFNTADPVQFGCTLDKEYQLALDNGLITQAEAEKIAKNGNGHRSSI